MEAGAEFVQTQICFDLDPMRRWLELLGKAGLRDRVRVLAGIAPVRRLRIARYLNERVAGVSLSPSIMSRLESASDAEAEGMQIAAELLARRAVSPNWPVFICSRSVRQTASAGSSTPRRLCEDLNPFGGQELSNFTRVGEVGEIDSQTDVQ